MKKLRTLLLAIGITLGVNFAISEVAESPSGRIQAEDTGGVEMPKPPRPQPSVVTGGVEMPKPPRP